jgi:HNH endonuclease
MDQPNPSPAHHRSVEIASQAIVAWQKLRCYNGVMNMTSVQSLSDQELIHNLEGAAAHERGATVQLVALLAEMDARRLFLEQGYSSLFGYCTKRLHLSEHAAYGRIEAARAARRLPLLLEKLTDGSITLTTICLLSNHLTEENHKQLLEAARHKTRREVEELVAALHPMPPVPSSVRRLPQPDKVTVGARHARAQGDDPVAPCFTAIASSSEPPGVPLRVSAPPVVRPLAPELYKVQFTVGRDTHEKLRRVQELMRHVIPNADVAAIFDRALTLLLKEVERQKIAVVDRTRDLSAVNSRNRHVPAAVKREVWARDQGQCAFVGTSGRCDERGFLEFHHLIPFADGGQTTVENLQLRCRAHNDYEAKKWWESEAAGERRRP